MGVTGLAKAKLKWAVLIIGTLAIITLAVFKMNQININQQEMLIQSEACVQQNGTVVVEEEGFLSLPTTYCE